MKRIAAGLASLATLFACTVSAGFAAEASYPSRPVRLIIPFAAGGGSDAVARIIAPKMSDAMGQTWVVDNRGGAAGNLAAELVARANPDGHTVLLGFSTVLTANPLLYKLPFTVAKDLQPVTLLAKGDHIIVVHPSVQANTFKDFIALAKQKPGAINYASAGVGSSNHLAAELLKKRAGIDMLHVAYKGGGPAAAAVLAGESRMLVASIPSTVQFISAGRLKALATTGTKRNKLTPELPTVAESGYPGYEAIAWYALFVPGPTPRRIVDRIHAEALKAMQFADVQTVMTRQGLDPESSSPAELGALVKNETAVWAGVIKDAGIRLD